MIRRTGAVLHWGIDEPRELEQQVPALQFVDAIAAYDREQIARLPLGMRLLYEITLPFRRCVAWAAAALSLRHAVLGGWPRGLAAALLMRLRRPCAGALR
ncbi:hypothetical protein [Pseudomonas nitroreducens]|uniref:hypothetical protein n=1 Tax=Pseudomonas nitroreducens TaxID=46680 RepID=UPI0004BACE20